jgi:hypothetical protein
MDRGTLDVRGARVGVASVDCASRLSRSSVGRALVNDFEDQVRFRGGSTIYLGTDDENNRTSLGGVDLYLDPLGAAARIQNLGRHPFEFYRKMGFAIVGVLPDANGFGKPDIFMAKRVQNGALTTGCSGRRWVKCQDTNGSAPPPNRDVRHQTCVRFYFSS